MSIEPCPKCGVNNMFLGVGADECMDCWNREHPTVEQLESAVVEAAMAHHELLESTSSIELLDDAGDALEAACLALKKARGAA